MNIEDEARRLADLLRDKTVQAARRTKPSELVIEFADGFRLYVNARGDDLELSVTAGARSSDG